MIAQQPRGHTKGNAKLANALKSHARPAPRQAPTLDCQQPGAPADLPTTHGLMLASIEGRLLKLEQQVTNQNRILLIGVIAIVGDVVRQVLKP